MSGGGGGPCGACKFLRRKCVAGCVFAPYFDAHEGTTHFAAVHKVFGASNAAKLLMRVPPNRRLDAVVTICYEALARVHDPVYGCVSHIFSLHQQVLNLQAELALVQSHLSTAVGIPPPSRPLENHSPAAAAETSFSPDVTSTTTNNVNGNMSSSILQLHRICQQEQEVDLERKEEGDLHALAHEFVSKYLSGVKFRPPSPNC